ncbi:MAG: cytochrome C biogenesis protein, partial [Deltaproteobacteria bacterium]|nr:cytochrome C biogenesis protein [Deltaproteobacteria bacterium]
LVQRYLDWSEGSRGPAIAKAVCAVLLLLAAAYLIYIT